MGRRVCSVSPLFARSADTLLTPTSLLCYDRFEVYFSCDLTPENVHALEGVGHNTVKADHI